MSSDRQPLSQPATLPRRRLLAAALAAGPAAVLLPGRAIAQLGDILTAPKTIIDRAIEARSSEDIARDNAIVVKVNGVMADLGTIKASTEIYEQRLLVTGLFDDHKLYDRFERGVRGVAGVKRLHWHVAYMSKAEQEKQKRRLYAWDDVLVMESKAEARLIGTAGVADVNFRIAGDAFGTIYLIGRARSGEEKAKAVARARDGRDVKRIIDYVVVRP